MVPKVRLFFGPNHRYFFSDGRGTYKFRATPRFVDYINKTNISEIYSVAFGENETFYIAFRQQGPTIYHNYMWGDAGDPYPKLKSWLFDEGLQHDGSQVSVSLGPNGSFFASSNQGHRWHNLPESAMDHYQRFTRPDLFASRRIHQIDLGFNGAYLGVQMGGIWFWDTGNEYPRFDSTVLPNRITNASYVTINPYAPNQHFVLFEDGTFDVSLPPEWAADIAEVFQQYTQQLQPQYSVPPPQQMFQPQHLPQNTQKKPRFWNRHSSGSGSSSNPSSPPLNTASSQYGQLYTQPAPQRPVQAQSSGGHSTAGETIHLVNNAYDAYSNVTNTFGSGGGGGSPVDVNQTIQTMNDSMGVFNNVVNGGSQGMQAINSLTNTAMQTGQIAGQFGGALAACAVM